MRPERGENRRGLNVPASPAEIRRRQEEGRAAFLARFDVSRETLQRLDRFVARLTEWQGRTNLVAANSLGEVWSRHIADSLGLERLLPRFAQCVDLGSGGGLPAVVLAACRPSARVDMIESVSKKAAFLRAVQRDLGLAGTVHAARIETCGTALDAADCVTARALAPLTDLFGLVAGRIQPATPCYFQKGRQHDEEIAAASAQWRFTMVKHESGLEDGSVVLEIRDLMRR